MSLVRLLLVLAALLVAGAGCSASQRPQLKVLGVEQSGNVHDGRQIKLFVEVTNYAKRPMRLQRLQYVFGTDGAPGSRGEVLLSRTVEAGSAVVVEVPIMVPLLSAEQLNAGAGMQLTGELITEQDQIIRAYPVSADVADDSPGRRF